MDIPSIDHLYIQMNTLNLSPGRLCIRLIVVECVLHAAHTLLKQNLEIWKKIILEKLNWIEIYNKMEMSQKWCYFLDKQSLLKDTFRIVYGEFVFLPELFVAQFKKAKSFHINQLFFNQIWPIRIPKSWIFIMIKKLL